MIEPLIITPRKQWWERLLDWFKGWSPQVKGVVITAVVTSLVAGVGWRIASRANNSKAPVNITGDNVNQAGRDLTINNNGISPEELRKTLQSLSLAESHERYMKAYPQGYVLLGLANTKQVLVEPKVSDRIVQAEWDKTTLVIEAERGLATVIFPEFSFRGQSERWLGYQPIRFVENQPIPLNIAPGVFLEVLDTSKNIFIIGFK